MMIKIGFPKWRSGNFISRVFRVVFERPKTKKIFGIGLPAMMVISSPLTAMVATSSFQAQTSLTIIRPPEVIKTLHTFQKPVIGTISQGYHWYHGAVDIADNNNAKVLPIATGKVIESDYSLWGYGNYVVVQHGETLTSLYGHLQSINVKVDDEVKMDTVLGKVGSTGRSTGPHLHLEIMDAGVKLNPYSIIEGL